MLWDVRVGGITKKQNKKTGKYLFIYRYRDYNMTGALR